MLNKARPVIVCFVAGACALFCISSPRAQPPLIFQTQTALLGAFTYENQWQVDKHPRFLADVNGDGRADIVGFGDNAVWVALGQADGHFSQAFEAYTAAFSYNVGDWRVEKHPRLL